MNPKRTTRTKAQTTFIVRTAAEQVGTKSQKTLDGTKNKEPNNTSLSYLHYSDNIDADVEDVVTIHKNETFLWHGAQSRLCESIKKKRKEQKSPKNLRLYLSVQCGAIDSLNRHGNMMIGLYGMKLAAMAFGAEFTFRCNESELNESVLWWLQSKANTLLSEGKNNRSSVNSTLYVPPLPTPDIACRGYGRVALHYTSEYVRNDFRAMATKLLSSMNNKGIVIDDVAIHFRCGDVLGKFSPKDKNYGLVKFQAYRKRIPPSAETIGIITAPFSEKHRRKQDRRSGEFCRTLVLELVDYLQSHFPAAKIRVRNNPNETIPEVLSRLILAKHNFCVRSTFCLLPSMASYGTSHLQKGGTAYFMEDASRVYDNIQLMDEPFLLTRDIVDGGFNSTLGWLTES